MSVPQKYGAMEGIFTPGRLGDMMNHGEKQLSRLHQLLVAGEAREATDKLLKQLSRFNQSLAEFALTHQDEIRSAFEHELWVIVRRHGDNAGVIVGDPLPRGEAVAKANGLWSGTYCTDWQHNSMEVEIISPGSTSGDDIHVFTVRRFNGTP